jgi:hypothetical protein
MEGEVAELLPVLGGALVGLTTARLTGGLIGRVAMLAVVLLGVAAATVSGEIERSLGYVLVDMLQAALAFGAARATARYAGRLAGERRG